MWRESGTPPHIGSFRYVINVGGKTMQPQTPTKGAPMTVRGVDGKPHLVSDMKREPRPVPPPRIRPIVPNIFHTPD